MHKLSKGMRFLGIGTGVAAAIGWIVFMLNQMKSFPAPIPAVSWLTLFVGILICFALGFVLIWAIDWAIDRFD